jgi:hypothetical protein
VLPAYICLRPSDRVLVGLATGTAVYLAALPAPIIPKITSSSSMFRGAVSSLLLLDAESYRVRESLPSSFVLMLYLKLAIPYVRSVPTVNIVPVPQ